VTDGAINPAIARTLYGDVLFTRLDLRAPQPKLAKAGDVGYDLPVLDGGEVPPHGYARFASGLAIACPPGVWAMIVGRSSTWRERGLISMMGIIDNGYTGELLSGVYNPSSSAVHVEAGARLKQVIFMPAITPAWIEVDQLPETERGPSGFGSSGR